MKKVLMLSIIMVLLAVFHAPIVAQQEEQKDVMVQLPNGTWIKPKPGLNVEQIIKKQKLLMLQQEAEKKAKAKLENAPTTSATTIQPIKESKGNVHILESSPVFFLQAVEARQRQEQLHNAQIIREFGQKYYAPRPNAGSVDEMLFGEMDDDERAYQVSTGVNPLHYSALGDTAHTKFMRRRKWEDFRKRELDRGSPPVSYSLGRISNTLDAMYDYRVIIRRY